MTKGGVGPHLIGAWLTSRSLARGLPLPVREFDGFRVDTNSETEVARWVFPKIGPGLQALGRSILEPRYFLKLCAPACELRAALPLGWELHPPGYFMRSTGEAVKAQLPDGYKIETERAGVVSAARIWARTGELAASGYAAEACNVFIYDRIVTEPEHRRKGLGRAVMAALHATKLQSSAPELLVATEDGRALYSALGWKTVSQYSTASIVKP